MGRILLSAFLVVFLLFGVSKGLPLEKEEMPEPSAVLSPAGRLSPAASPGETGVERLPLEEEKLSYIRVPWTGAGEELLPSLKRIGTKEEFEAYLEQLSRLFAIDGGGFDFAGIWETAKYGEEFFRQNDLLVLYLTEGSGSVRHRVSGLVISDATLTVEMERLVPEIGTCDMAAWLIPVEVSKTAVAGCEEFVVRCQDGRR